MSNRYIRKLFHAYYKANAPDFPELSELPQREFAFLNWNRPGMFRHLGYPNKKLLVDYLIRTAPRHAYHSASYYLYPGADKMDKKGFQGCDLVFDIDSDHIPTPCRETHNFAICKQCGKEYRGSNPLVCECGHKKFEKIVWICDECLEVSKNQVFHLIDNFLTKEFAIPLEDIQIFFSGHRGYHVHLEHEKFRHLDQDGRREIADYLTGTGFDFHFWGYEPIQHIWQGFDMHQKGWPGKIAKELYNVLNQDEASIRETFGNPRYGKPLATSIINRLLEERNFLLNKLMNYDRIWGISKVGKASWHRIFEILRDRIKADIDVVVSIDLHRLIRLNGSLHGKTGFKVMRVDYEDLASFDPLTEALSFPSSHNNKLDIEITASICPPIRIQDTVYGPYVKGEQISVPLNTALFFLCKNVAEIN